MKFKNLDKINIEPLRKLLLYSYTPQSISIDETDFDWLVESASDLAIRTAKGNDLLSAIKGLDANELMAPDAQKALFVVKCSPGYSLPCRDLQYLTEYIELFFPNADVRWGMATSHNNEHNVTVIVVTTFVNKLKNKENEREAILHG